MKITDPQVIKDGEQDLIEAVLEDLDQDAVRTILQERMARAALAPQGGQIVVHDNEIAFRLDFQLNVSGSLLFDREGNYIAPSGGPESQADPAPAGSGQDAADQDTAALEGTAPEDPDSPASSQSPKIPPPPEQNRDEIILDDHFDEADMDMGALPPKTANLFDARDDEPDALDLADDLLEEADPELSEPQSRETDTGAADALDQVDLEAASGEDLLTDDLTQELTEDLTDDLTIDLPDYDSPEADILEDDGLVDDNADQPDPDLSSDASQDLEDAPDPQKGTSLDDDINEILQESREFWEKNNS